MKNTQKITRSVSDERGFTIVELTIATLIFSLILTVITAGVISFTTRYYKGVNASTMQTTARTVLDTVSQAVQFGTSPVTVTTVGTNYFCAGGHSFTFSSTGAMYNGANNAGLYMAPMGSVCGSASTGGKQLLGKNMRVTSLSVTQVTGQPNVYKISLGLAYGADDLFCSPSVGNCNNNTSLTNWWKDDIQCKGSTGTQFCAVSKLTTVVAQRVAP